jgi:peptide/nickel transport system permease protein
VGWRRHLSLSGIGVLAALIAFLLLALIAPLLWGHRADAVNLTAIDQGSSWAHPFGTDDLGRDVFARTLVATRLSLALAAATAVLGFALGVLIGILPAVLGPRPRKAVGSAINLLVAFPGLLLALLVTAIVGAGAKGVVIALAIAGAPTAARLTQTLAASVGGSEYVAAARLIGIGRARLLARHVLPNVAPPLVLQFALAISSALLAFSALSFLGLGVQQPDYDWGALLNAGTDRIYVTPIAALGPAAAIVLASLAINRAGDLVASALALDPATPARRRRRHREAADYLEEPVAIPAGEASADVLRVEGLSVTFATSEGPVTPVRDVSFDVRAGERLGIVGESGSGKSLTALASADLIEPPGHARARLFALDGHDVRQLDDADSRRLFATTLAMVFQDALSSLNPAMRNGRQIAEPAEVHLGMTRRAARERAIARLRELSIAGADRRMRQFPHELSGGMRQRAVIAMGLMTQPRLIIADEPTTALDVTVQRQVLHVLHQINAEHGTAIVLISHDMSVIAGFCERILVMYGGRVVEEVETARLHDAAHPYTRALLGAVPDMQTDRDEPLATIPGRPPRADELDAGCPFAPRCPFATERCRQEVPPLERLAPGVRAACWHPQGLAAAPGQVTEERR